MTAVVGILLAAGSSHRFGAHKLLSPLASGELLGVAAARNLAAGLPDSLAVVRPGDRELAERFAALGLRVVENPQADRGMGRTLAAGVSSAADASGWLVALADMPWIQPRTIACLVNELRRGASLVAPIHDGRRGHPVGFAAEWRTQLQGLCGEQGARTLLADHASELTQLATADRGVLLDVDQPADLHRL